MMAVVFLALHVLTSVLDTYVHIGWAAVVVPFTSALQPLLGRRRCGCRRPDARRVRLEPAALADARRGRGAPCTGWPTCVGRSRWPTRSAWGPMPARPGSSLSGWCAWPPSPSPWPGGSGVARQASARTAHATAPGRAAQAAGARRSRRSGVTPCLRRARAVPTVEPLPDAGPPGRPGGACGRPRPGARCRGARPPVARGLRRRCSRLRVSPAAAAPGSLPPSSWPSPTPAAGAVPSSSTAWRVSRPATRTSCSCCGPPPRARRRAAAGRGDLRRGQVIVCIPAGRDHVAAAVRAALAERAAAGCSPVPEDARPAARPLRRRRGVGARRLARDGTSLPTFRPDKGVPLRIGRRGVLVHNAETLAHVAMIARTGPEAFRAHGVVEDPGTSLVTVSGAVEHAGRGRGRPGHPARRRSRHGPRRAGRSAALLVGGYGGTWVGTGRISRRRMPPCRCGPSARPPGSASSSCWVADACGVAESARIAALPGRAERRPVWSLRLRAARHRGRHGPPGPGTGRPGSGGASGAPPGRGQRPGSMPAPRRGRDLVRSALAVFADDVRAHLPRRAVSSLEPPDRSCGSHDAREVA